MARPLLLFQQSVKDSTAFVRGNYIKVLESYTNSRDKLGAKPGSRRQG